MSFPKTSEELMSILKNSKCVVIKFSAKWCGPCKNPKFLNSYNELKENYKNSDVVFFEFDVDDNEDLVNDEKFNFNISSIPMIKIYNNGKKFSEYLGTVFLKEIRTDIDNLVIQ